MHRCWEGPQTQVALKGFISHNPFQVDTDPYFRVHLPDSPGLRRGKVGDGNSAPGYWGEEIFCLRASTSIYVAGISLLEQKVLVIAAAAKLYLQKEEFR